MATSRSGPGTGSHPNNFPGPDNRDKDPRLDSRRMSPLPDQPWAPETRGHHPPRPRPSWSDSSPGFPILLCDGEIQSARPEACTFLSIIMTSPYNAPTLNVGSVISVSGMRPDISGSGPGVSGMIPDCEVLTTRGVTAATSPSWKIYCVNSYITDSWRLKFLGLYI